MHFEYVEIPDWPPLVWLACCQEHGKLVIYQGARLETADDWFCEAVWADDFAAGDFDQTDIIAGSGARKRGSRVIFVSSGSTCDRLQSVATHEGTWVSNSLACLLAVLRGSPQIGYPRYFQDFDSIILGLKDYQKNLHTSAGPVRLTYFNNLAWDGTSLRNIPKPGDNRDFSTFDKYHGFLTECLSKIAVNLADSRRKQPYKMLSTLSSGYDSTTVTTLASRLGCTEVLSFARAYSGDPDDGSEAAKVLGVRLHILQRESWQSISYSEVPFIAADHKGEDRYYVAAEDLLPGKVLLTGYHGDKMWDKRTIDLSENIVRGDKSGLSLTDYRLRVGFIHCPIPFWGARQIRDVNTISKSKGMKSWDVPGNYSRPICRRIAEGAGVPREAFGIKKQVASIQIFNFIDYLTAEAMRDYILWAFRHRWELVSKGHLPLVISRSLDRSIYLLLDGTQALANQLMTFMARTPILWRYCGNKTLYKIRHIKNLMPPLYLRRHVFPWAMEHAKQRYAEPFRQWETAQTNEKKADSRSEAS